MRRNAHIIGAVLNRVEPRPAPVLLLGVLPQGIREVLHQGRVVAPAFRSSPHSMATAPLLILEPTTGFARLNLREVWAYRELLYFLIWRDVKVRYKQTVLGVAWAILQPVLTMVVFSVFFGRLAKMPSDGVPYPIFAFAALLPWQLFAFALDRVVQQPGRQPEPDHQGLLPAADRAAGRGARRARRFRRRLRRAARPDARTTASRRRRPSCCCRSSCCSRWRRRSPSGCGCRR